MENVPQVIGGGAIADFVQWREFLEGLGYKNYTQLMNAKGYGIPQNRNRCFMVSILGDYDYIFPPEFPLRYLLKDFIDEEVDEKYYISDEAAEKLIAQITTAKSTTVYANYKRIDKFDTEVAKTLCARDYKGFGTGFDTMNAVVEVKCEQIGILSGGKWDKLHDIGRRVYGVNGLAPTMHTCGGGNLEPKIADLNYRIRKLTEREFFRLMGVKREDFERIAKKQSMSSLYHLAGDSIVTACLMAIFGLLLEVDYKQKITELTEELKEK